MDLFPLWNSLIFAGISTLIVFLPGVFTAYKITKAPRVLKFLLNLLLTLPLAVPPAAVAFLVVFVIDPEHPAGARLLELFTDGAILNRLAAVFAMAVLIFPLMFRAARGAFESFDQTLAYSAQTLGLSDNYIFWRLRVPWCRRGTLIGAVLAFVRALGEYAAAYMIAGYAPGSTAVIPTTIFQLWSTGEKEQALTWVLVSLGLSCVVLVVLTLLENSSNKPVSGRKRA